MSTLLLGCPDKVSAPIDAGLPFGDASTELVDAGPPVPPAPRELTIEISADGGTETIDGVISIDAVKSFDVRLNVPLKDYRLRLIDETEHVVPSDERATESDGGIDYLIELQEPLKPGRRYTLSVDAEVGTVVDDALGRPYADLDQKLQVRGERIPEPKTGRSKKHGH